MDLLGRLFILSLIKENKKFTNVFTRNISELSGIKISNAVTMKRSFLNIAVDTVALTETANTFSQSLSGLIHRCRI